MAQMCQDHSFTLPHILSWKTCSGKLWDVMTGAKQHHSRRQLAQAPLHQRSPVTFNKGKSQLLLFFSPLPGWCQVLGYTHKSKFPEEFVYPWHWKPCNCTPSTKLQLPEVSTELPKSCCVICCIQNGIIEKYCEIIVIEICQDARVAVTHLQK